MNMSVAVKVTAEVGKRGVQEVVGTTALRTN